MHITTNISRVFKALLRGRSEGGHNVLSNKKCYEKSEIREHCSESLLSRALGRDYTAIANKLFNRVTRSRSMGTYSDQSLSLPREALRCTHTEAMRVTSDGHDTRIRVQRCRMERDLRREVCSLTVCGWARGTSVCERKVGIWQLDNNRLTCGV